MMKIMDSLFLRCLDAEAWNMTFYERLSALESQHAGKQPAEIRKELRERQKHHYQKLLERVENQDPGYSAEIDDRDPRDVL